MSNFHKDLGESNLHNSKGFTAGLNMSRPVKNELGDQTFEKGSPLPPALEFVDGASAPPTSIDGDIYVIASNSSTIHADWSNSGTTAAVGDWARVQGGIWNLYTPILGDLCFDKDAIEFNKWNGTAWVSAGGGITDGDKGDIVVSSLGTVWTIDADVVDNTKLANMAESTIKGRATGAGTGYPQDLTATQVRTLINVADGANAYTHPNHSGDVTSVGDGAQTAQPAIITGKPTATVASTDLILIADVSASNALKQVTAQSIANLNPVIFTSSGTLSTLRTGSGSVTGDYNTISGGANNNITAGTRGTISGGQNHVISFGNYNTIGGGLGITMSGAATSATAAGGTSHVITNEGCFVGGGTTHTVSGLYSVCCGGTTNTVSGSRGVNAGGQTNIVDGSFSGNLGGINNDINGFTKAFIVGSDITADRANCTFVENLSIKSIPTSSAGLPSGSVWNDSGTLKIV